MNGLQKTKRGELRWLISNVDNCTDAPPLRGVKSFHRQPVPIKDTFPVKHFIYTIKRVQPRGQGYENRTLRLYRVTKGVPVFVRERKYTFESDEQAALNTMKLAKALPKEYFECSKVHGGYIWHGGSLADAKVATLTYLHA